ncbi:MAG: glycyl-radical enzyme activating protein [Clostridium sp.]|uniref:glycyl-radical enzyme activating protein n=1 Tax=Clostridium TaxID=1485 RepID=UPI0029022C56|nr:glycyl-radical enzyme activating protein [Clostridium sp.]MDU1279838.1 glycyl-radical enzyme activating protein [Clostridium sp.]MDU1566571.1 glycyl-radical enzyme activating protein [Clostridium sp.]MDU4737693.1 glycyl-radical enzyme activating protein [Clostridium sp.]MDU7086450.1 glycyl-radical enzyme activating protein [Clostridium sp.]MDU7948307.1 glycyl-radical enzyme activating protein [Clostridium sp.]
MSRKGIVFDIQRFSVNDGPGIRTTVFMKGCYLRCPWCHNPESISPKIQLKYNPRNCTVCGKCVEHVNGDGIKIVNDKLSIDFNKHDQNFELINVCPNNAYEIYGKEYSSDELIEIIIKDIDYYNVSGGGVTFSGGEAINQFEFIKEVSIKLKEIGIHICLDISGYDPENQIEKSIEFIDEYLLDYKLTEKESYKKNIKREFDFYKVIEVLKNHNKSTILRCPIIPSVNDYEDHFKAICKISNDYENIRYVDILPYHSLTKMYKFKYINKHKKYEVPNKDMKELWKKILKENYLKNGYLENEII